MELDPMLNRSFLLPLLLLLLSTLFHCAVSCNGVDRDSLQSFFNALSYPINYTAHVDCCQWPGVACAGRRNRVPRVTHLWLPERNLTGTISPSLANLTFLSHLNLSHNRFSGPFPFTILRALNRLQVLDLSFNRFSGNLSSGAALPVSVRTLDLSSNRFNGTIFDSSFLKTASNLVTFNASNNTFSGPIPSWICTIAPFVEVLDFSANDFSGQVPTGIVNCSNLRVLRAGFNSLTGNLPEEIYRLRKITEISLPANHFTGKINGSIVMLSSLRVLELHVNDLSGELPENIGRLSNLEQLQLHTNSFNGSLPPSLMNCSNLTTLLLRNNLLGGEISTLDFSKLHRLNAVDLGNNSFYGRIPDSLCFCRSITAIRLAYNRLTGEVPPCMASLHSLDHLSLSDNFLWNVNGALKILRHCRNLAVLFTSRCFHNEMMPDDNDLLQFSGFQNLQILTLGGCALTGKIPPWIANLKKLKVLNLSYNNVSGPIPTWLGSMPNLFVLNFTQNFLSGDLPREIGALPALISDNSSTDLSYLALPFLFDSLQYNRLFNLPRGLKVGNNSLTGNIPEELGRLKLLHILDLSYNHFNGGISNQLSNLVNLERLDVSGNHLSGKIPESLTGLSFLSSFSVAHNDLEGEIPRGGQFDTFPASAFEGNPNLCGHQVMRPCPVITPVDTPPREEEHHGSSWFNWVFFLGYFVGMSGVVTLFLLVTFGRRVKRANNNNSLQHMMSVYNVSIIFPTRLGYGEPTISV